MLRTELKVCPARSLNGDFGVSGARGGTRTPTPLLASGPKPGASTNFATRAGGADNGPMLRDWRSGKPGILDDRGEVVRRYASPDRVFPAGQFGRSRAGNWAPSATSSPPWTIPPWE